MNKRDLRGSRGLRYKEREGLANVGMSPHVLH